MDSNTALVVFCQPVHVQALLHTHGATQLLILDVWVFFRAGRTKQPHASQQEEDCVAILHHRVWCCVSSRVGVPPVLCYAFFLLRPCLQPAVPTQGVPRNVT